MNSKLVRNAIRCKMCNEVLESKSVHDFVRCMCENKAFADGGLEYSRRGAMNMDMIENLCEYKDNSSDSFSSDSEREKN